MTAVIDRSCNWIRNHFPKDKVNKFSIVVIMLYYYIGLLSYITVPIKPVYKLFTSGSSIAVIVRALMTIMIVLYCFIVIIVNKKKIQWRWAVLFTYILLFTLLSMAISPQTYNYMYISQRNYLVVYLIKSSAGFNRLFTMFLSSISDFALAFCFLFILPIVLNNKKQILLLTLPIVIIGLLECVYSLITEREDYYKLINMIDPQYGGYNINIGASFGNKEDWGAFATVSFCSTIASYFCINSRKTKWFLVKLFLLFSAFFIYIFTIASLCKTAIGAQTLCIIVVSFYLLVASFRRGYLRFIISLFVFIIFYMSILLFLTVPLFHSVGFFDKIYKVISSYIISPIMGGAASSRTEIWTRFINNLRTYNLFFGLSKGGVATYSQAITVEGQSAVHNGFAYFFGSYGLLGIAVYLVLLFIVLYRIILLFKYDKGLTIMLFGLFVSAFVFSLSEAEVLIVSGSNPIFIFNILLCSFSKGILCHYSEVKNEVL